MGSNREPKNLGGGSPPVLAYSNTLELRAIKFYM